MSPNLRPWGALAVLLLLISSPASPAPAPAAPPVKLVVIISVDGLSWPRLKGYAPWYEAGLKRLLAESQVETDAHYAHLNTETCPGHASLSTGAPPRVHGIVANRWIAANPNGPGLRRFYCTDQPDAHRVPGQPPLFYREIEKDGRLFVFAHQHQLEVWQASGDLGRQAVTAAGEGPGGETLVFESDDARTLYNLRHGLPPANVPPSGNAPGAGNLRVATLADRLVEASPASRVVSLSGKDRAAIYLAGRNPRHIVYWYDKETGRYTSSAAWETEGVVGSLGRDLVRRFNQDRAGNQLVGRFGTVWKPLPDPGKSGLPQPASDLTRFQIPDLGLGFDHDLAHHPRGYFEAVYNTPFQDQLLTDLALTFLADPGIGLGRRGVPDLLALSFSAHDLVSHNFGNESAEELDALRRLDRELGRLLAALDDLARSAPAGDVVLAFSADHGFAPLPEVTRRETDKRTGGRLLSTECDVFTRRDPGKRLAGRMLTHECDAENAYPNFQERLDRALTEELCLPPGTEPIFGVEGWTIAYDRSIFPRTSVEGPCGPAGRTVTLADLDQALPRVVRRLFGDEVQEVLLNSQRDRWPADDPAVPFVRNDFDEARSGDAYVIPREGVLMHWDPARGSGHGSQYEYDTHVPLLFWGGPFRAGERTTPSAPYDLAVTLADLLGLRLPDATGTSRLR
jgi:hypothetical protein